MFLVLVICFGMLPGEIFAADGPTEVTGVETSDGKFGMHVTRKAGRADGDKPAASAADLSYPFDDWDEYTAYAGIARQAEEFVSHARTMEDALAEQEEMLRRVIELLTQASNGTNTETDVGAAFNEIAQLQSEYARLCEATYVECPDGTGWYGLRGGSVEFGLPWSGAGTEHLLRLEIPDMGALFMASGVAEMRADIATGIEKANGILDNIRKCQGSVGARRIMAEDIQDFAGVCSDHQSVYQIGAGAFDTLGPDAYDFADTDPEKIFTSTRDNAWAHISFAQFFEGALTSMHNSLQGINERKVRLLNDENIDGVDRLGLQEEIRQLNFGIRYVMDAASYDGFHFLSEPGKAVTCPLGWKDLCHHEIRLQYDRTWTLGDDPSLDEIHGAINSVSLLRSYLGASQNGLEHIVDFCDYVLTNGPVLGNTFNRDGEGHHTVENPSEAFVKVAGDMMGRIGELTEQMQNDTCTDFDKSMIMMEMTTLVDYFDLIVDMVKTEVGGVVAVAEPEHDYTQAITLGKDQSEYKYRIRYSSAMSDVSRVSLVDYLENGDNSVYAGVLTGIGLPTDIDPDKIEVYVMLDAIDFTPHDGYGHTTLPDGAWEKVDPDTFKDWDRVYSVGVYFGDTVFGPEIGQRPQVDVVLDMKLDMGAKSNSVITDMPAGGYVLKNSIVTCELPGDASEAVRKGSETFTTVTQLPTEENAVSVDNSVMNQVWTDPGSVPTGPEDSPNWGTDYDAPIGSEVWYRTVIDFGGVTAENVPLAGRGLSQAAQNARLRNLVLSQLLDRVTPDYDSMRVWQGGTELAAGKDYRLFTSDFHMYSDDFDPAHASDVTSLMALRNQIQHTWCPYYTFGMIFSNDLVLDVGGDNTPVMRPVIEVMKTSDGLKLDNGTGNLKANYTVTVTNKSGYDIYGLELTDVMDHPVLTESGETGNWESSVKLTFSNWKAKKTADGTNADVSPIRGGANDLTHVLQLLERGETFADGQTVTLTYTVEVENVNDKAAVHMGLNNKAQAGCWSKAPSIVQPRSTVIRNGDESDVVVSAETSGIYPLRGLRGQITGLEQAGSPQYSPEDIIIIYKARLDTNAFLTGNDGAGHSIEANGMPVRFVTQANVATLGCSAMDETMFDALVAGSGDDLLPRFAGAEDVDVDAIEAAGSIPGSVDRTVSVSSSSALVHNYGFDIVKLDEENKLLQGGTFEVRSDPDDKESAIEFVRVDWMDGNNRGDWYPEGPVYRLAVDSDPQDARTTEIEAGKAILVGLDSGMYYVVEKKSPAGYIRDYAVHSVELLSLSETVSEIRQAAQSMLAQANQANQSVLDDGGTSSGVSCGSGIRVERAGDDAAPDLFVQRCYQAWANLIPISVDGEGYDLSEFGWKQKCVPGIAFFDRNEDGEYVYGSSSAVLQIGDRVGMELRGTPENPLKGGVPIVNQPGSEYALPKTGGTGIAPYIALGSTMALLSGLLLAGRKKRR